MNYRVKFYDESRGFGFLQPIDGAGPDIFCHASALKRSGILTLNPGDVADCEIGPSSKSPGRDEVVRLKLLPT